MGSGASNQTVGVPANPRVIYSDALGKRERKRLRIDAPVLVDVEHGSVRYRYGNKESTENADPHKTKGKPFEGTNRINKDHYFYHARLNDFSEKGSREKEDDFKFMYVQKGPNRAKEKKLFYVYGKGWNAMDGQRRLPSETKQEGRDFAWPLETRIPNDVYYNLSFTLQDAEIEDTPEDRLVVDLSSTANKQTIELTLTDADTAKDIQKKIAYKILKSANSIHICHKGKELRDEDVIGDLRESEEGSWTVFKVKMHLF
ncbi:uncharacterized protein LOC132549960 [Ylistrum balloti]|uniref:uncharacterized protein LOC132549960 n=1 Tax=Ylistrum balloti TaxID=509963 RepID=UPI00290597C3|nr:uncharacterized protein LOC132549960 [Ylistrum balloti]